MSYIGVGYTGSDEEFLVSTTEELMPWLRGDRLPRFFGKRFVVFYDSNTAREFVKKCKLRAEEKTIKVYLMEQIGE